MYIIFRYYCTGEKKPEEKEIICPIFNFDGAPDRSESLKTTAGPGEKTII